MDRKLVDSPGGWGSGSGKKRYILQNTFAKCADIGYNTM